MIFTEVDFTLLQGYEKNKVFVVTDKVSGSPINLSTEFKRVELQFVASDSSDPVADTQTLLASVGGDNNNEATVPFLQSHTANVGLYNYKLLGIANTVGEEPTLLVPGNFQVLDIDEYTKSIEAYIETELPSTLTLSINDKNNLVRYWRHYLQPCVTPEVADADVDDASKWPFLFNVLIAKLVVYDTLMKKLKEGLVSTTSSESSSSSSGDIKSIETGPARVEFYDASEKQSKLLSKNSSGNAALDLKQGICVLAQRLKIYIPLCDEVKADFITPVKATRLETYDSETYLLKYYS